MFILNQTIQSELYISIKKIRLSVLLPDSSPFSLYNGDSDRLAVLYLDSLFKVEHFPVDLVSNHSCVHLRIHHLYG